MKNKIASMLVCGLMASGAHASNGGIQDFLDSLRDFESGINPALADFYLQNLNNPVYTYAQVSAPGKMVRDCATGSMIPEPTTINEFFTKLGVDQFYDTNTPYDAQMYRDMQYNSLNAWGFVGYQLGEALLIDTGYYSPVTGVVDGVEYDKFYIFVDDSNWIGCETEALVEVEGSGGNKVIATSLNNWEGTFIGKNGINSFADLRIPEKQELVMRDAMRFNYNVMTQLLEDANMTWAQALAKSWPDTDDNGNPIQVQATMSGLLAASHLRGAWGTAKLLTTDQITCDELGTCITKYVHKFGGFNTLFDTPATETIEGSAYDEVMSAGWGDDTVITGGGVDTLLLHEESGSAVTVNDFTVGEDRIILRDWADTAPLANLVVSDTTDGALLSFSAQSVLLKGATAAQINADPAAVIVQSDVYTIAWSGTQVANNFDPAVDKIRGTAGIGFKHLKAYESNGSLFVGVQAGDGGIYSYIEMPGLGLSDLHVDMFDNMTGSFDRLGYIVSLGWLNWGWNAVVTVDTFVPEKTVINMSVFQHSFSELQLTQSGADTVLSLTTAASGGNNKQLVLKNTQISDLSGANFEGVSGNFADITTDIPVFFDISVSVSGGNGSVSPAPDGNGVINAQGNQDFTLTFVPDSGYAVDTLTVDGVSQTAAGSYTFSNLSANHSVVVTFAVGTSCPAAWDAGAVYTGGDEVSYQGVIYRAKWWTQGNTPGTGGVWESQGSC
ncbi:carbohydrate-binding protein [Lacimicrobium alkaliphilum]|uniref:Chitin-binding type-3 domain-containing protein n=1 Tax=Lacimicrobium alkaliphilum TaxID=1526571 RepID=A0ABQ1RPG5_9ALTE|nr:carbohydrate-binding protein [Lacimicrobium alkaliphilum]GGD74788.1 hypothetical protein GCM10011357_32210 [Lacimicrobium alkaliphilum]